MENKELLMSFEDLSMENSIKRLRRSSKNKTESKNLKEQSHDESKNTLRMLINLAIQEVVYQYTLKTALSLLR